MMIELRGNEASFRKLVKAILADQPFPSTELHGFIAEIEDQLEPNADREFDFIELDELMGED